MRLSKGSNMKTNGILSTIAATALVFSSSLSALAAVPDVPTFKFRGYINGTANICVQYVSSDMTYEVQMKLAREDDFSTVSGTTNEFYHSWEGIHVLNWSKTTNLLETAQFRIRACNSDGSSDWSGVFSLEPHFAAKGSRICSIEKTSDSKNEAFDGNQVTFFENQTGWVGLDLGKPTTIKALRAASRFNFSGRLANATFQCADLPDFSDATDLYTIPSSGWDATAVMEYDLAKPVTARYFRLYKMIATDYFSVTELEFELARPGFGAPALSVSVTDWTNQWAKLTWSYPADAHCASGIVQRATSSGGPFTNLTPEGLAPNVTTYTDTNAVIGVTYAYRIQGVCTITGLENAGEASSTACYMRGYRLERSWDTLGTLNVGMSVLAPQVSTIWYPASYAFDGNKDTFADMELNPYIGLDLSGKYYVSSCLLYSRSTPPDLTSFNRINNTPLWGTTNSAFPLTSALLTPTGVGISNWCAFVSQDIFSLCRYVFFHRGDGTSWNGNVAEIGLFGCSEAERTAAMTDILTAPSSVSVARCNGNARLDIAWTAGYNVASYTLQRSLYCHDDWTDVASGLTSSTLSFSDTTVAAGKTYEYRLVAINGANSATSGTSSACSYYTPGTGTGLLGAYSCPFYQASYTNAESVRQTRVDPSINFAWGDSASLIDSVNSASNYVKITWTGKLSVPCLGTYVFTATANDACALRIDGAFVFNRWTSSSASVTLVGTNTLTAGEHDIRLDYLQQTGAKSCVLKWGGVVVPTEVIPSSQLIPAASFTDNIGDWKCRTFFEPELGIHTNNADGSITISGWGGDLGGTAQAYTYVWREFTGAFDFQAKITCSAQGSSAKGLLMVRNRLDNDLSGLLFAPFLFKPLAWGVKARTNSTDTIRDHIPWGNFTGKTNPSWFRLCRGGTTFYAMGKNSETEDWQIYDTFDDTGDQFGRNVYIGMAVCSPDSGSSSAQNLFTFSDIVLKRHLTGSIITLK
jgi:hypothetical protein